MNANAREAGHQSHKVIRNCIRLLSGMPLILEVCDRVAADFVLMRRVYRMQYMNTQAVAEHPANAIFLACARDHHQSDFDSACVSVKAQLRRSSLLLNDLSSYVSASCECHMCRLSMLQALCPGRKG